PLHATTWGRDRRPLSPVPPTPLSRVQTSFGYTPPRHAVEPLRRRTAPPGRRPDTLRHLRQRARPRPAGSRRPECPAQVPARSAAPLPSRWEPGTAHGSAPRAAETHLPASAPDQVGAAG